MTLLNQIKWLKKKYKGQPGYLVMSKKIFRDIKEIAKTNKSILS